MRTRSGVLVGQAFDGQRALEDQRRGDRVAHAFEHGEDAVALAFALDDVAVLALDAGVDDRVVACQRLAHAVGLTLPEARAALDIGQQEGNHTGWQRWRRVHVLVFGLNRPLLKSPRAEPADFLSVPIEFRSSNPVGWPSG